MSNLCFWMSIIGFDCWVNSNSLFKRIQLLIFWDTLSSSCFQRNVAEVDRATKLIIVSQSLESIYFNSIPSLGWGLFKTRRVCFRSCSSPCSRPCRSSPQAGSAADPRCSACSDDSSSSSSLAAASAAARASQRSVEATGRCGCRGGIGRRRGALSREICPFRFCPAAAAIFLPRDATGFWPPSENWRSVSASAAASAESAACKSCRTRPRPFRAKPPAFRSWERSAAVGWRRQRRRGCWLCWN